MNLVETYVSNITSAELKHNDNHNLDYYELIADTDCYGVKETQKKLILCKDDYKHIMTHGWYLT